MKLHFYCNPARRFGCTVFSAAPIAVCVLLLAPCAAWSAAAPAPIILTGADRRPSISLNGEWSSIVDPYFAGLFSFHHQEKANGWFLNQKAKPGDPFPTEYDFSKATKLKVPGDWNTQRDNLFFYEGPIWYQRDFTYQPKEHARLFLHVGAANYRSWFWVNGKKVCEHEGGYTSFNCELTSVVHAGDNFVVAAVDNTRHEDNVPTLENRLVELWRLDPRSIADRASGFLRRSIRSAPEPRRSICD
jgi:beta-glucuronidase